MWDYFSTGGQFPRDQFAISSSNFRLRFVFPITYRAWRESQLAPQEGYAIVSALETVSINQGARLRSLRKGVDWDDTTSPRLACQTGSERPREGVSGGGCCAGLILHEPFLRRAESQRRAKRVLLAPARKHSTTALLGSRTQLSALAHGA